MTSEQPALTIVIAAIDGPDLVNCLGSLLPQVDSERVEVVAAGVPQLGDFAKRYTASYGHTFRFLATDQPGFVPGYVRGADAATGEWLLFFDDDTVVPPGFMSRFLELIETTDADILGLAAMPLPEDAYLPQSIRYLELALRRTLHRPIAIWMSQMACRRAVYEDLGGFAIEHGLNLSGRGGFITRARRRDLKAVYLPDVAVYDHSQTVAEVIRLEWRSVKRVDARRSAAYYRLPYAIALVVGAIAAVVGMGTRLRLPMLTGGTLAGLAVAAAVGATVRAPLRFVPGIFLAVGMRSVFMVLRAMLYVRARAQKRSET
ncbi:MAG TPA: glycosyltransferase [Dehalococcoidia bacterium]|nr:glycosyltransferase [Dehalococcoidia bacterium]